MNVDDSAIEIAEDESTKAKYIAKREAAVVFEDIVPFDQTANQQEASESFFLLISGSIIRND